MDTLIAFAAALPGVVAMTAGPNSDAPESAWGDTFFFFDPAGDTPEAQRFPFATIVASDYPGFDELSRLDRDGVFRLNISVGRERFRELIGHAPSTHAEHQDEFDHAALDLLLPHPAYGQQAWVCVLNPGPNTLELAKELLREARDRAARAAG